MILPDSPAEVMDSLCDRSIQVFLIGGTRLTGIVTNVYNWGVVLTRDDKTCHIFYSSIASYIPE